MVRTTLVTMIGNFYMFGNFQLGIWPGKGSYPRIPHVVSKSDRDHGTATRL